MAIDLFLLTPMGLSALVFTVVGYAVGMEQTAILRTSWWIPVVTALVASAAGEVLFAVVGAVVGERGLVSSRLLVIVAVVGIANGLLATVVIRLLRWAVPSESTRGAFAR
jgi:rod shape-determining protein MreD